MPHAFAILAGGGGGGGAAVIGAIGGGGGGGGGAPADATAVNLSFNSGGNLLVSFSHTGTRTGFKIALGVGAAAAASCAGTATTATASFTTPSANNFTRVLTGPFLANTTYHVRVCAVSAGGTASGGRSVANATSGALGQLTFDASSYNASEADRYLRIPVTRTGGSFGRITADITFTDGTANRGDYNSTTQNISFAHGVTKVLVIVPLTLDTDAEERETFTMNLSNMTSTAGAVTSVLGSTTATIYDVQNADNSRCRGSDRCIIVKLIDPSQPDFRETLGAFPIAGDGSYSISNLQIPKGYKVALEVVDTRAGQESFKRMNVVDANDTFVDIDMESTLIAEQLANTTGRLSSRRQSLLTTAGNIKTAMTGLGMDPDNMADGSLLLFLNKYKTNIQNVIDGTTDAGTSFTGFTDDPIIEAAPAGGGGGGVGGP